MNLWVFKYAPQSVDEMVLNEDVKITLKNVIQEKPNVLISGPPGTGKGTFTDIFLRDTGLAKSKDFLKVNASDETSIENIRSNVKSFATAMCLGDFKLVYLNEADYLSPNAQAMLRQLMEDVQAFTRFFLLCNYPNKIIDPILSRCQHIQLCAAPAADIFKHCMKILKAEGISCSSKEEKEYVIKLVKTYYPDIRRIVNALQKSVVDGKLHIRALVTDNQLYTDIFTAICKKDLDGVRILLRGNTIDYIELYQFLYNNIDKFENGAAAILTIGEYMYRHSLVAIPEINFMTMIADLIMKRAV